jgi:hypothetical protein
MAEAVTSQDRLAIQKPTLLNVTLRVTKVLLGCLVTEGGGGCQRQQVPCVAEASDCRGPVRHFPNLGLTISQDGTGQWFSQRAAQQKSSAID